MEIFYLLQQTIFQPSSDTVINFIHDMYFSWIVNSNVLTGSVELPYHSGKNEGYGKNCQAVIIGVLLRAVRIESGCDELMHNLGVNTTFLPSSDGN